MDKEIDEAVEELAKSSDATDPNNPYLLAI